MEKIGIKQFTLNELKEYFKQLGQKPYRAEQV